MHAEHAQRVDVQTSALLNQVVLVLVAKAPRLLTLKGSVRASDMEGGTTLPASLNLLLDVQLIVRPNGSDTQSQRHENTSLTTWTVSHQHVISL
jgi:hypothetical protein